MSCVKENNIYIEHKYAYVPEAQECKQPLHSHVNIHYQCSRYVTKYGRIVRFMIQA